MYEKAEAFAKEYRLVGARLVKNLQVRKFEAYYCGSRGEAVEKVMSLMPEGSSVSWGGSVTIHEIGLIDRVYGAKLRILDRDKAASAERRFEMMRDAFLCDTYLISVNASRRGCPKCRGGSR